MGHFSKRRRTVGRQNKIYLVTLKVRPCFIFRLQIRHKDILIALGESAEFIYLTDLYFTRFLITDIFRSPPIWPGAKYEIFLFVFPIYQVHYLQIENLKHSTISCFQALGYQFNH